ncbi:MAG TPA: SRPBCC family protein [Nocardioides sp.]|jgi:carbon monoxide dehydrogenase subunit G|nr:SRPBCC family protein [Nocardioides sp.]
MDLEHSFTVPVGVEEAWAHFQDISSVAECFPGAQVTGVDGEHFNGSVKVKLGPIALVYNGSGTFIEKDEAAHRFVVDAKGKDKRGNGTAGAKVTLTMGANGDSTDVTVLTDLAITGKPAQFGRGVMQDVSDKLLGQFVACLEQRLGEDGATAPTESVPASAVGTTAAAPDAADVSGTAPAAEVSAAASPATTGEAPAAPSPPGEPTEEATAAEATPAAAAAAPVAPATPTPAATTPAATPPAATPPAARAAAPAQARGSDDALDLGKTVLPVLARAYWKQALAALVVVIVIIWLIVR